MWDEYFIISIFWTIDKVDWIRYEIAVHSSLTASHIVYIDYIDWITIGISLDCRWFQINQSQ